jgi:DNA-binding transcriptional MerR regulator
MVEGMATGSRTEAGRKVGELETASGLTVRTLHHYEAIGLLVASGRTDAGHRRYDDSDVERLYRICLLRRLGLPLSEIARALDDPAWSLRGAMAMHLSQLEQRLEAGSRLRGRLVNLVSSLDRPEDPRTEDLLEVLEEMTMLDATVQRRISILVYADLEVAFDYLIEVFGLGPGQLFRDDTGRIVHGEIEAGDGVIWLHPESKEYGLASPRTVGAMTGGVVIIVDDVDAHFRHTVAQGATIRYEPVDQEYGYREYSALDSEGGLWSFMKPLD